MSSVKLPSLPLMFQLFSLTVNSVNVSHMFSFIFQQEIARHLRPRTLRALYGIDKVKNAVHCTDLPEDGLLEVRKFLINKLINFCFYIVTEAMSVAHLAYDLMFSPKVVGSSHKFGCYILCGKNTLFTPVLSEMVSSNLQSYSVPVQD